MMEQIAFGERSTQAPPRNTDIESYPKAIRVCYAKNMRASARYAEELEHRKDVLEKVFFEDDADLCVDGRVSDFGDAIGVKLGLVDLYRSPGSKVDLGCKPFLDRVLKSVRAADAVHLRGKVRRLVKRRMVTAHYSSSRPTSASCAAWEHNTDAYKAANRRKAERLNRSFPGRMVAFPVLVDTDFDSLTVMGPEGGLDMLHLVREAEGREVPFEKIIDQLHRVFPSDWGPLCALDSVYREAFHPELAERLMANAKFVQDVIDSHRPVELLDHKEDLILIGRHFDWISPEDHNKVFVMDDTIERADMLDGFEMELKYVTRNVIQRAMLEDDRDWQVPVMINIPYDDEMDRAAVTEYARMLIMDHMARLAFSSTTVLSWLYAHGLSEGPLPDWLVRQLPGFKERVFFAGSVSYRKDRLFRPFV